MLHEKDLFRCSYITSDKQYKNSIFIWVFLYCSLEEIKHPNKKIFRPTSDDGHYDQK